MEAVIGFSRGVRSGDYIALSGTAPIGVDGKTVGVDDVAAQTRRCFEIAEKALRELGVGLQNVIRTRVMLTDRAQWRDAANVHGEFFQEIKPACTFVIVDGFIDPEWLVEIEIDAIAPTQSNYPNYQC